MGVGNLRSQDLSGERTLLLRRRKINTAVWHAMCGLVAIEVWLMRRHPEMGNDVCFALEECL